MEKAKKKVSELYNVRAISYEDTKEFILTKHYAQRMPSVSYSFGLFEGEDLRGVLTIGKPASHSLCIGILGKEHSEQVYELNRLITDDGLEENSLSFFVGRALRTLKQEDLVIVSYADTGMNHSGYIYQATNFIYTGATKGRTDKYTPTNKHSRHYNNDDNHLRKVRTSKHRYVFFTKNKKLADKLNYPIQPYPKTENQTYTLGERMKTKVINRDTGEEFYQ